VIAQRKRARRYHSSGNICTEVAFAVGHRCFGRATYEDDAPANGLAERTATKFMLGDTAVLLIRDGDVVCAFGAKCPMPALRWQARGGTCDDG
jgi:hypothetical protein